MTLVDGLVETSLQAIELGSGERHDHRYTNEVESTLFQI